jgi:hypothetical protein
MTSHIQKKMAPTDFDDMTKYMTIIFLLSYHKMEGMKVVKKKTMMKKN